MKYKFGFIGCGNMGGALASAVASANDASSVAVCDYFPEKVQSLVDKFGVIASNTSDLAAESAFIFLGVKPQGFDELFSQIKGILSKRTDRFVLVTMAAGVSISAVEKLAGAKYPVIRIMPNTPVSVGSGMVLYTSNDAVTDSDLDTFISAMSAVGKLDAIPEDKIDAASALSGCGPAFVYMFAEALADGAVECGLPRDKAMLYAAQTILGSAQLLIQSGKHPGLLKDEVCSPGGTTIAGVHALESSAFRGATSSAVTAAYQKTLNLKK